MKKRNDDFAESFEHGNESAPLVDGSRKSPSYVFVVVATWIMFVEGMGGIASLAIQYYFKDDMKVDPATLSTIQSIAAFPWCLKPVFGFISDGFPVMGFRRKPYIMMGGFIGALSWFLFAGAVNSVWGGFVCMLLSNIGIAMANVIAEALIVERSRGEEQHYASTLQSIIWGSFSVAGVIAAFLSGWLIKYISYKSTFALAGIFPLTLVFCAMLIEEKTHAPVSLTVIKSQAKQLLNTVLLPNILRPCVFIFLLNGTPSSGATWFYFYTDVLKFDSEFIGFIGTVGSIAQLAGVFLFQSMLTRAHYRSILMWSTIASAFLGLTNLIVIFRWNVHWGIPDGFFMLGESAIGSVVGWINTMPVLVLAARLCPSGMEATMYALIMSINNFGSVVGTLTGSILTDMLGVTAKHLENFWLLVLICNLTTLLPLLLINWIPEEDPVDIQAAPLHDEVQVSSYGAVAPIDN
jgi:folate/biopterin transporter